MSSYNYNLYLEFREHIPTEDWETRKYRIAYFIELCLYDYYYSIDENWQKAISADESNIADEVSSFSCNCYLGYDLVMIEDCEYLGGPSRAEEALVQGMKKYYPDIDYEFSCQYTDGDLCVDERISVTDGVINRETESYDAEDEENYDYVRDW